jgi:isopropylmalate/homocitrate/citramalate synthase
MDLVRSTAKAGGLVIWEEAARDGAQAKTLMTAEQRVAVARATGDLFGKHGPHHVIFAAGFPAISTEEFEIMRQLADQVDNCTLAHHGRARRDDIDLGVRALGSAKYARLTFFIPVSAKTAAAMGFKEPAAALERGLDILAYALDKGSGMPVDVALVDIVHADPGAVADAAMKLTDAGASIIKLCDTVGAFYPNSCRRFFDALFARLSDDLLIGFHQHNDLGLALPNNLEAIRTGVRIVASSWLGIGERNGLAPTEQMIFALGFQPESLVDRLGCEAKFWLTPPDLHGILPIARAVSKFVGLPIRVTDAIIGTGVNSISTGTPFRDTTAFRLFDPAQVLGMTPEVTLTHLASRYVIVAVAAEGGMTLEEPAVEEAMRWVKARAYQQGRAEVSKAKFFDYLRQQGASQTTAG